MSNENTIVLVGNVTDDAELKFTPSGQAVANFTVAVNRRYKDRNGEWTDKLDGYFRCNVWGQMAENTADALMKGTRVIVTGRLQQRTWEDKEGNKRREVEVQVDEVGPSLKWAKATIMRTQRSGPRSDFGAPQESPAPQWGGQTPAPAPAPEWGTQAPAQTPPSEAPVSQPSEAPVSQPSEPTSQPPAEWASATPAREPVGDYGEPEGAI